MLFIEFHSPFGHSLRPLLESVFGPSKIPPPRHQTPVAEVPQATPMSGQSGKVVHATSLSQARSLIGASSGAVVLFTSPNCPPCRVAEPEFANMAAEFPDVLALEVNVFSHRDIGAHFAISATPTFVVFDKGSKVKSLFRIRGCLSSNCSCRSKKSVGLTVLAWKAAFDF